MDKEILILKNMLNSNYNYIYRDENNNIIVDGNIDIINNDYDDFLVKFYKVNGSISWCGFTDGMKMGSLKHMTNFPDIVTGNVFISKNDKLTSLDGCPKEIGGSLVCNNCNIKDIKGITNVHIGKNFIASNNPINDITSINNCVIKGTINLSGTNWAEQNKNLDTSIIVENKVVNSLFG